MSFGLSNDCFLNHYSPNLTAGGRPAQVWQQVVAPSLGHRSDKAQVSLWSSSPAGGAKLASELCGHSGGQQRKRLQFLDLV